MVGLVERLLLETDSEMLGSVMVNCGEYSSTPARRVREGTIELLLGGWIAKS